MNTVIINGSVYPYESASVNYGDHYSGPPACSGERDKPEIGQRVKIVLVLKDFQDGAKLTREVLLSFLDHSNFTGVMTSINEVWIPDVRQVQKPGCWPEMEDFGHKLSTLELKGWELR
jgi:hypothetical protein